MRESCLYHYHRSTASIKILRRLYNWSACDTASIACQLKLIAFDRHLTMPAGDQTDCVARHLSEDEHGKRSRWRVKHGMNNTLR